MLGLVKKGGKGEVRGEDPNIGSARAMRGKVERR